MRGHGYLIILSHINFFVRSHHMITLDLNTARRETAVKQKQLKLSEVQSMFSDHLRVIVQVRRKLTKLILNADT